MRLCGGILKSDTISFGQNLVPEVIDRAIQVGERVRSAARRRLDAAGVPGRLLRAEAKQAGAQVVIVNAEPTEMDDIADAVLARRDRHDPAALVGRV